MYTNHLKPLIIYSLVAIGLASSVSCKTEFMPEGKLPKQHVAIGSYGGLTGLNEKTVFLKNGMVYRYETLPGDVTKVTFVKEMRRKDARKIFKTIGKINFDKLVNDDPANMNFYLERNRWLREDKIYRWYKELDTTNADHKLILKLLSLQKLAQ